MRSQELDNMTMDEVLRRARVAGEKAYWLRVAQTKLSEYRRDMPRMEKFVPDVDWRANATRWENDIAIIAR